jgi:hypothetical protein
MPNKGQTHLLVVYMSARALMNVMTPSARMSTLPLRDRSPTAKPNNRKKDILSWSALILKCINLLQLGAASGFTCLPVCVQIHKP